MDTPSTPLLLDTSVLSDFLAEKEPVRSRLTAYVRSVGLLHLSMLSWYEIERGLRRNGNSKRRRALERFVGENVVYEVTRPVLDRAADVWCQVRRSGRGVGDVDILIAATALSHGLGVVTKDRDYHAIDGLHVELWHLPAPTEA